MVSEPTVPLDDIAVVRRFNRTVTERVGALNEEYLARGRALGASRLLWEIDGDVTDVRVLRNRLGLDSGYLSRLLQRLEQDRLVTVEVSAGDGRVRTARLTRSGVDERRVLDECSDELAAAMLAPLDPDRRRRLVDAMATVERLLTAAAVTVDVEDPASVDAERCLTAYVDELDRRFESGFDVTTGISADPSELVEPHGVFLIARLRGEPVGCAALKLHGRRPAEVKRMWVASATRGLGVGRRLLGALEAEAVGRRVKALRLETNHALTEAIALYRSAGYAEVGAFNDEPHAHHWFEKRL